LAALSLALAGSSACSDDASSSRPYFEREIQPILTARCTTSGGGPCHVNDGTGRAMGNLDLSSFENVQKRPDVLRRFGSYPFPLLLMKAIASPPMTDIPLQVGPVADVPLFIRHAGGPVLTLQDPSFFTLERWLQNGATLDGLPPPPREYKPGPCSPDIRTDLFAQQTLDLVDTNSAEYKQFAETVWPVINGDPSVETPDGSENIGCKGRECHGVRDSTHVPTIELYFTCGDDDTQMRFNYLMARTYTGEGGRGQLSEKPLAGGGYHAGGKPFASVDDPRYKAIRDWAAADTPFKLQESEGEAFFRANVQPVLLSNGCYLEACHSLVNFNFYKPLAGTDGLFGTRVNLHNYLQARFMLGLESRDPTQGRLLKKNLVNGTIGIPHRGGPLLEPINNCNLDVTAVRADPTRRWFEEATGGCVVYAWHQLERAIAIDNGQLDPDPGAVGVFVRRPKNSDRLIDFATYRPGADLLRMDLALDADGKLTGLAGAPTSLLGNCGINVANADVRRPDIRGDGQEVIFAMRTSASEGLDLWKVDIDGSNCERLGLAGGTDSTGEPIHHFDPAYGPGNVILFASTRGDDSHSDPARRYPSRTPKFFLPASNIWVFAPGGTPRRLSYLNGSEFAPRMRRTREAIYSVEKAAPDFYQISTRTIRIDDGGGYLPQLGQRPKMGYGQVVEMRELIDFRNVFIASDPGTYFAGGTLGIQDLTLGLEELSFDTPGFFHPVKILDEAAAARPGEPGSGAYRSPTPLPDGRILVAYSPGNVDLGNPSASVDYGLWVVDPQGLEDPWELYDSPGDFDIEPVVAYRRIYVPQPLRVHQGDAQRGEYIFHSIPLFAPLLEDGSIRILVPASTPISMELLDTEGNVIDWQREEEQIGVGETQPRLIRGELFNAVCGGCHNALDGSELDVAVGPDVITGASTRSDAANSEAVDLYTDPSMRPASPLPP